MEPTCVVPIAAILAAMQNTFRIGDESESIDLAKTADEGRRCEFLPSALPGHRPLFSRVEFRFEPLPCAGLAVLA